MMERIIRVTGRTTFGWMRRWNNWRMGAPAAFLGLLLMPAALRAADPAPLAPPEKPAAEPVLAAQPDRQPADDDELKAAEARMRQAEIDYLRAKIDYEHLKGEHAVAGLQEQLKSAQAALVRVSPAMDDEGFIKKWLVAGPIAVDEKVSNHDENSCKEFLDKPYVPAESAPKEGDTVSTGDADLPWKAVAAADYFVSLDTVATDEGKNAENSAYLGVAYVISAQEVPDVKLAIGSDDDSVWRLNGTEVVRAYEGRAVDKDQNQSQPLTLKQGVNVLSFTVLNADGPSAAAARFLDKDGNPVAGLTISVKPPGQ